LQETAQNRAKIRQIGDAEITNNWDKYWQGLIYDARQKAKDNESRQAKLDLQDLQNLVSYNPTKAGI